MHLLWSIKGCVNHQGGDSTLMAVCHSAFSHIPTTQNHCNFLPVHLLFKSHLPHISEHHRAACYYCICFLFPTASTTSIDRMNWHRNKVYWQVYIVGLITSNKVGLMRQGSVNEDVWWKGRRASVRNGGVAVSGFEEEEMWLRRGTERQNVWVCVPVYVVSYVSVCVPVYVVMLSYVSNQKSYS